MCNINFDADREITSGLRGNGSGGGLYLGAKGE